MGSLRPALSATTVVTRTSVGAYLTTRLEAEPAGQRQGRPGTSTPLPALRARNLCSVDREKKRKKSYQIEAATSENKKGKRSVYIYHAGKSIDCLILVHRSTKLLLLLNGVRDTTWVLRTSALPYVPSKSTSCKPDIAPNPKKKVLSLRTFYVLRAVSIPTKLSYHSSQVSTVVIIKKGDERTESNVQSDSTKQQFASA